MAKKDYTALMRDVETLRNVVLTVATNGALHKQAYSEIRLELLSDKELEPLVPSFLKMCRREDELWAHLSDVASGDGSYRLRRRYINEQFRPIQDHLEGKVIAGKSSPHEAEVADALFSLDSAEVAELWTKALARCETDPDGAITAARSLVESACKHILDELGVAYKDSDDAPSLYNKVAKELNLAPDQHAEPMFKQTLSGAISIVNGLSGVANKYGDRHGAGSGKRSKPSPRHARLVVNAAGTVTAFLVDTWGERKK